MNIDDCKFLFYLTGKCFLSKETNAKYLYVKHFKNMLCYQGWDKNTPYLNASKRKTFSLPVGQYVSAFNFYNNRHPNNPHTPTLVLKINGNTTIVTIEDVMIKANKDSEQELVLKINDNYETHSTNKTLSIDGSSMKLDDIENNSDLEVMNMVCELMISSMSYKYLNHDKYLSNLQVPFSKKEYEQRYSVFGGLFSYSGKGHINLNFLLEDECEITRDGEDFILSIKKNLCGFQVWHQSCVELNKIETRNVYNVLPSQFQSIMNQHGTMIENFGFKINEMGFQPTCIFRVDNGSKLYIGVIKDIEIDHSFQGFESGGNISTNKIRLSTAQTSGNLGGRKNNIALKENDLPLGTHAISMHIDSSELPWGVEPTSSTVSNSSNEWFSGSSPASNTPNVTGYGDGINAQLNELVRVYKEFDATYDSSDLSNSEEFLSGPEMATLIQLAYTVSVEMGVSLYQQYLSDLITCLHTELEGDACKKADETANTVANENLDLDLVTQSDGDTKSTEDIILNDFKKYGLGLANFIALDRGFRFVTALFSSSGRAEIGSFLRGIGPSLNNGWKSFFNSGVGRFFTGRTGFSYDVSVEYFSGLGDLGSGVDKAFSKLDPSGEYRKEISKGKKVAEGKKAEFRERTGYPGDNAKPEKVEEWKNETAIDEEGRRVSVTDENNEKRYLTNEEYEKMQYKNTVYEEVDPEVLRDFNQNVLDTSIEIERDVDFATDLGTEISDSIVEMRNNLVKVGKVVKTETGELVLSEAGAVAAEAGEVEAGELFGQIAEDVLKVAEL